MPRRLKRIPPPAVSVQEMGVPPETIQAPPGDAPVRPKIGRPSNAEKEARIRAEREANMLRPEQTLYMTSSILGMLQVAVKGDDATPEEIEAVNGPLCQVVNKYPSQWMPEFALAASVFMVTLAMRRRGKAKRDAAKIAASSGNGEKIEPDDILDPLDIPPSRGVDA